MRKTRLINWVCIIITGFIFSFWYYISSTGNNDFTIDKEKLKKSVDATINDISFKEFNHKGELTNFLETPMIEHIPQQNTHLLTRPHIVVREENKEPWDISAQYAKAVKGGKKIIFSNDVSIAQQKEVGKGNILLSTEEITYFPNKKYAITRKNVKLQQNNSIVKATGLEAFLAENRIKFLSNTRGHYEKENS